MKDIPTIDVMVPVCRLRTRVRAPSVSVIDYVRDRVVPEINIKALFRYDPVGLEKYQERRRGIEQRLDKVIRRQ
jgi:hypothetical protein